jgi:hypothetical protein
VFFDSKISPLTIIKLAKFPFFKEPMFVWFAIFAGISVKAANAFSFGKPNSTAFLKLVKKSFEFF